MIICVDDALNFSNDSGLMDEFESSLKKRFSLSLLGQTKWYLAMRINQEKDYITIDQDQYIKNIVSRFEKSFKHSFKLKLTPLPSNFIPTKKDYPVTETQSKEVKVRFGNLNYRSVTVALLYASCCTRPDTCYAVNKLTKYSNNPEIDHYRALLH